MQSPVEPAPLEFRRYLALRLLVPEPLALFSRLVDEVWHTAIVHTRLYDDLCRRVLDRFLDHDPRSGHYPSAPGVMADPGAYWRDFRNAYQRFWDALPELWLLAQLSATGIAHRHQ